MEPITRTGLNHVENREGYRDFVKKIAKKYREEIRNGYAIDVAAGAVSTMHRPGGTSTMQTMAQVFGKEIRIDDDSVKPVCPASVIQFSSPVDGEKERREGLSEVAHRRFVRDLQEAVKQ